MRNCGVEAVFLTDGHRKKPSAAGAGDRRRKALIHPDAGLFARQELIGSRQSVQTAPQ